MAKTKIIKINHYLNSGKEANILGFRVDVFDVADQTIYEFHGCRFHEHHCQKIKYGHDLITRNKRTNNFFKKDNGYTVIEKFKCES